MTNSKYGHVLRKEEIAQRAQHVVVDDATRIMDFALMICDLN